MLRALATLVAVLVLGAIALVATLPATWLAQRIAAATDNAVTLVDTSGTAWRGHGMLASTDGRWRLPLAWRIQPAQLLHGALAITLEPASGLDTPRGTLTLAPSTTRIDGLAIVLPAALLDAPRRGFVTGGDFMLNVATLEFAGDRVGGAGSLRWERARVAVRNGPTVALGTVAADVAPQGAGLAGKLANEGGDVRVAGAFEAGPQGAAIDATLAPRPGAPAEIARTLAALGPPDASGVVRVAWRAAPR